MNKKSNKIMNHQHTNIYTFTLTTWSRISRIAIINNNEASVLIETMGE